MDETVCRKEGKLILKVPSNLNDAAMKKQFKSEVLETGKYFPISEIQ